MGPCEIAVVQISLTKYIMKCYHDMVDQIPPKRILWPWNQWESHCLHRWPHIWNSHERCVTSSEHEGIPAWTKGKPSSSTDIYRMCRTRHFRWKGQCATEIQLLNTPHDRRCCRHASDDATLMQFDWHALFPGKNWRMHFCHRGWGRQRYMPPRLRGDMATPTLIALDSSSWVVSPRGDHSGCALVIARRGETTHSGVDVHNTHLSMINPLNKPLPQPMWAQLYVKICSDGTKPLHEPTSMYYQRCFVAFTW